MSEIDANAIVDEAISVLDETETAIEEKGVNVPEGTPASEYDDFIRQISGGGSGTECPIKYVESTDTNNPLYLRDLESGTYILYGRFRPYNGSTNTCTFSTGMLVSVIRNTSISYMQIFYSKNNTIQYCEITDDTYKRTDAKLINMETTANLTTTIDENSDDTHYPSAKAVYNAVGEFVKDPNYVHTDNNFTNEDKSLISANGRLALTAINIARGANQAKSFNNYSEMIEFLNQNPNWGAISGTTLEYQVGQNIMIGTINVPDLWIASKAGASYEKYTYTTDEVFINDLNTALANGEFLRVGFVTLGVLETQKVDLTEYSTTDQMNAAIQTAIGTVLGGAS